MPKEDKNQKEEKESGYIKWLFELSKDDINVAGGKGANLAEMFNIKLPVPPAFIVTAKAFSDFVEPAKGIIEEIINETDVDNTPQLNESGKKIRELIEKQEMSKEMENEILEAYETLGAEKHDAKIGEDVLNILKIAKELIFVAVRSSATTEDLSTASFAGQQESFLNVKGNKQLIEKIKKCFSSLYTPRAIYYREKRGFHRAKSLLTVIVQKMINSEKSGVMFTKNPIKGEGILIEAVFGLGEGIVSGKINPDSYIVSQELEVIDKKIGDKKKALVRSSSGETEEVKLTEEKNNRQVLTDGEIKSLANYGLKIEEHYKKPQDIEFAIENKEIYIVQSRPITTTAKEKTWELKGKVLLTGLAASPGIGTGKVKIVRSMKDLEKVKKGDVLVTEMTNPDMVVTMQKSDAIITDEGGSTSHASIVSREMGIPAVVGTKNATSILKEGQVVTVDGTSGKVYEGEVGEEKKEEILPIVQTKTKIKVILDLPDFAERAVKTQCEGVGLLRLEGIIAESGKHPLMFLAENRTEAYSDIIRKGVEKITRYFKSVWIRTSDIRSDEFRNLQGAPKEIELNPMLGFHGVRFSLKNKNILESELFAVKKVAEKFPNKEFGIMFPQIISVEETREARKIFEKFKKENIKLGIMVETPAACEIISELTEEGLDFISLGSNDLTQYTLAVDRGNENVQNLYNEMHPAVLKQIEKVIKVCKEKGVETSICGQAASKKEMVKFLVEKGIDSISVNADVAYEISEFVQQLEKEILKKQQEERVEEAEEKKEIEKEAAEVEKEEKKEEKPEETAQQEEFPDTDIGFDIFSPVREEVSSVVTKPKREEFPEINIGFDFFKPVRGSEIKDTSLTEENLMGEMMREAGKQEEKPIVGSVVKHDEKSDEEIEEESEDDELKEIIDELQGKKDEDDIDIEEKEEILDIF